MNEAFAAWLKGHYASLINLPPTNPAMLHHALVGLLGSWRMCQMHVCTDRHDGLALDQWVTVRQILRADRNLVSIGDL